MHIPDGFLSLPVCGLTAAGAAASAGLSCLTKYRTENHNLSPSSTGLVAAFVFAVQMVNIPVTMGTSCHMLGGALAAILLGPVTATLVLSGVLVTQCLFLYDGGFTTLGANIFNIPLMGVWSGWAVYHLLGGNKRPLFAATAAGWVSVMIAAFFCSVELALSGTISAGLVFPAMLSIHAIMGLFEAAVTVVIIYTLLGQKTYFLNHKVQLSPILTAAMILMLLILAPFTCGWPDGLELVAQKLGFSSKGITYSMSSFALFTSGLFGALMVGAFGILIGKRYGRIL